MNPSSFAKSNQFDLTVDAFGAPIRMTTFGARFSRLAPIPSGVELSCGARTSKFQGLLALVIAAPHAGAALSADGVELVDEDDARGILLGLRL